MDQPDPNAHLLARVKEGDQHALAELFSSHRDRLWRIINFRLDGRLTGRVDADDILQEAYLAAAQRIQHYLDDSTQTFFVWLRLIANQTLIDVHRRHLGGSNARRKQRHVDTRTLCSSDLHVDCVPAPRQLHVAQPGDHEG